MRRLSARRCSPPSATSPRLLLRQRDSVAPGALDEAELERRIGDYERDAGVTLCGAQREGGAGGGRSRASP